MEEKLKQLFEANMVLANPRLDALIAETMERVEGSRKELSEEETEILAAAGDVNTLNAMTTRQRLRRIDINP